MGSDIFFSVIIPTFNRAHLILKTLDSVLNQSFQNFEIIIVDDGSTDNTSDILRPILSNQKMVYVRNETNMERSFSRNRGMEIAKGEFVTFIDSDDLMLKHNLYDAYNSIVIHPEYKFFHNLYHLIDINDKLIYKYPFPNIRNRVRAIALGNFLSCIGVFIHKDIYRTYKFDMSPSLKTSEDWEYWIRVLVDYDVFRIPKVNNAMVHHPSRSVNHLSIIKTIESINYINNKVATEPNLRQAYTKVYKTLLASTHWYVAYTATRSYHFGTAIRFLIKAFSYDPKIFFRYSFLRVLQISLFHQKRKI